MSLLQTNWRQLTDGKGSPIESWTANPDTSQIPEQPERYESLRDLIGVVMKYRGTVLAVAVVLFLSVLGACLLITPRYASTAIIEINRDASSEAPAGAESQGNLSAQVDDVQTEVTTDAAILQDSTLALEVIKALDLAHHAPFNRAIPKEEAGLSLDQAPITREKFLKLFKKSLKIEAVQGTRLIQITFRNPDPVIAAKVCNALSESFISDYLKRRVDSTTEVSGWIGKQLATLKFQVESSEKALADGERKTGLVGIDIPSERGSNGQTLQGHNPVLDRLDELNQELTAAQANRISSETVYKLIQTQDPEVVLGLASMSISSGGAVLGQGGGLELLRNLRAQALPLKIEYADQSSKYGAKNPRLIELRSQITTIDSEIADELKKIGKRAENDYLYAKNDESAILAKVHEQQKAADELNGESVHLQVLAEEAFSNRRLYESMLSELHQADVAAGVRANHLSIADRGQISGIPVIPNYPIALSIAAVGGMFLGIVTAFVRQSMDHSLTLPQDVENTAQIPVVAHLPLFAQGKSSIPVSSGESILINGHDTPLSEAFRALRTSIVLSRPEGRLKTLLITSPMPGDGKSTVAFNLAVAFAQQHKRVLLIDGDQRHADLHRHFGDIHGRGLSWALVSKTVSLAGLIAQHPKLDSLYLLRAGETPDLPGELLSSSTFDRLLTEAKANFDLIVLDSPPFLAFSDAAVLASKVDAVLPVVRSGVTSRSLLSTMTTQLKRMHAPVIGLVLNGTKEELMSLSYPYGHEKPKRRDGYARV